MTRQEFWQCEGLLVDTNILILIVIGYLEPSQIGKDKRTSAYTREDYFLLVEFTRFFKKLVTTTNILTEVSNLIEGLSYKGNPVLSVLPHLIETIEELSFPSRPVMNAETRFFARFGLSDTVSMAFAKKNYLVLTDDLKFYYYLESQHLPALNFNHLRTSSLLGL
ncbi:hypothetical protein [Larkinella soli]|uniref:hypothetical protein n=1 Tax=Larkinella soli TaxID=1770527 RepID=UPI000FFBBFE3|nr:hypothetical protein [Larkinella soli]